MVIGLIQAHDVSIQTVVLLQPALKLIVRISSHFNFHIGALRCGLCRALRLFKVNLCLCLGFAFFRAYGLPSGVSDDDAYQRADGSYYDGGDCF